MTILRHYDALWAPWAYLDSQWQANVLLRWDRDGTLTHVLPEANQQDIDTAGSVYKALGAALPGMPNLHSHAFQSAMSGLTEFRGQGQDSFWSWRDLMYRFAARLEPEHMQAIAHWLYIQMLKAGYTSVCEFHYLHHQRDGQNYAPISLLAQGVMEAASASGLAITLLPVLYQYSNFGSQAPRQDQQRFLNSPTQLLYLLESLHSSHPLNADRRYGIAPHSLRATNIASINTLIDGLHSLPSRHPIHIHIAEQMAEVLACQDVKGCSPVAYLYDNFNVDERWCLVHATHIDEQERKQIARSGAVAGLCLTTEANLGDGLFPAAAFLAEHGHMGIGSDSHICVDWRAELRLLEYGQRLISQQRNVLTSPQQPFVADYVFETCTRGGAQASGRASGQLSPGHQADLMVIDLEHSSLAGLDSQHWLSALVFSERAHANPIRDVFVSGKACVADGHHPQEEAAFAAYQETLSSLLNKA
ncbi:formimidoylglutamate deiminase [Alcaligenes aquatilis]|uniref:Formimidoylglutamate deiminase n=1 Tax=Alcaligenes aquatilis TaxID=323284 RepID=A0ABY4NH51_9BURK|nr:MULTISPECIES: formimidoylglutamate deiminase [Alcaligenes]UQN35884.1 formimidoylglutamate deiminase [Alcaligenes aquatilis]UYY87153.1 formimidoylglutamate deiminase [Alcaligenes sp. SMD-FA]HBQ90141.1 formimidoylglutamate deiminase [Alcaligenes faecalis]